MSSPSALAALGGISLRCVKVHTLIPEFALVATIDRPKTRNALNNDVYNDLIRILEAASKSDSVHCVILTGRGEFFSSGQDLKEAKINIGAVKRGESSVHSFASTRLMDAILGFPKLLIAAVNGPVIGIAAVMLLHFDLVYGSVNSYVWVPFFKLRLIPEFGSSQTLTKLMGRSRASQMLFCGKRLTAPEAKEVGIFADVFPRHQLLPQIKQELREVATQALSEKSIRIFKRMMTEDRRSLKEIFKSELNELEKRIRDGDVTFSEGQGSLQSKL